MSEIFAPFFEWGSLFVEPYSNDLFDGTGYTYLGLIMLLSSLMVMLVFYYLWNPIFGRWYHWGLMLAVSAVVAFGASYGVLNEELIKYLYNQDYPDVEFFIFTISGMAAFYTLVSSFILSFIVRIGSSNNKANPFPLKLR
ncbi:hypothetical protein [Nafulsella turpanensis]|uniref:hypothetical protein n=1 Tax=Nafulsella turpanensis TaxID=1265690 RepID=UPI00034C666D|nr:hypothetical protein [Nafulsella turpanensis]